MDRRMQRVQDPDSKEKESDNDPVYIKGILALHDKYTDMVKDQFASNALFQKALFEAFKEIVNTTPESSKYTP